MLPLAGIDVQHTVNTSQLFFSAPYEGTVYTTAYDGSLPVRVWNASVDEYPIAVAVDAISNALFIGIMTNDSGVLGGHVVRQLQL